MSLLQLKPKEQAFYQMARDLTKKLKNIILCEGKDDVETLKALISALNITCRNVGITDCEGISSLEEIAVYVATLARLSRNLEKIALVVDMDDKTARQRIQSLLNSLKAREVGVEEIQAISESLCKIKAGKLEVIVKAVGNVELPFQRHTMEDYLVKLLLLNGRIQNQQLMNVEEAKEIIEQEAHTIIRNSPIENVKLAYKNIIEFLNAAVD
jgi:5S rRNA maturation endonuclease (ribonuclease M5)